MFAVSASAQSGMNLPIYGLEDPRSSAAEAAQAPGASEVEAPPLQERPAVTPVSPPQQADYEKNENSNVFGAQLFTGAFARQAAVTFNADYAITVGDTINVRLWGAFTFQAPLTVDAQGNIFLPNVGPIYVLGVHNADLQARVAQAVRSTFKSNVSVYASLAAAQPVRVYVGGFVNRPGAYAGTSLDSVLHYLDQAGGVDPDRGSFLDVEVKRGSTVRARINLYDFLLSGSMPQVQLADGDVIFVHARHQVVSVSGLAENPKVFEFRGDALSLAELGRYARPLAEVTNVRVTRSAGMVRDVEYYSLSEAQSVSLSDGDMVAFTADKKPGTISVRVEGEHESRQEFVLPYGSRLGDVLGQIEYSERSVPENLQLFRVSVKERQQEALETSLRALEKAALTARSGTAEEAGLRKNEADLLLRFVDRARKIEAKGQVVIARSPDRNDLLLENGDIVHIPARDGLILVNGEVYFPNAVAYQPSWDVDDYIAQAGGLTNKANATQIVVAHQDGSFARTKKGDGVKLAAGDQVMVLPAIDKKNRQIFKELTQVLYQIAVSAGVVLGL